MNREEKRHYGGQAARYLFDDWVELRERLLATRLILGPDGHLHCEIWQYEYEIDSPLHVCSLGWEMNETLYMRNDFPRDIQWYLLSEINCAVACGASHNSVGHTVKRLSGSPGFRRWLRERQVLRYGSKVVDDFLLLGPNKIKTFGF